MFQMKDQDKTSEKGLKKWKYFDLLNKKFRIIVINMVTKLGIKMDEHCENFNKEIKNV